MSYYYPEFFGSFVNLPLKKKKMGPPKQIKLEISSLRLRHVFRKRTSKNVILVKSIKFDYSHFKKMPLTLERQFFANIQIFIPFKS